LTIIFIIDFEDQASLENKVKLKVCNLFKVWIMKKNIYLIIFAGIILLLNSCSAGYVSVEPAYHEVYIPARPGSNYIWIGANWYWNNRTRTYHHRDGYWALPRQGHNYQQGHWNKTRRGYRWVPGGWRR
jgi:hypothetical protein